MTEILSKIPGHGIYLMPGQVVIADKPSVIWTVLGSCVSIILYDRQKILGSICHAQLPEQRIYGMNCSDGCPDPCSQGAPDTNIYKFVTCSFKYMFQEMMSRGSSPGKIEAGIFGGSHLLKTNYGENVGEKNIKTARKLLEDSNLNVVRQHIGGDRGRKLIFNSGTGEVEVLLQEKKAEISKRLNRRKMNIS